MAYGPDDDRTFVLYAISYKLSALTLCPTR